MKCVICGKMIEDENKVYLDYGKDYGVCNSRGGCYLRIPKKRLGRIRTSKGKISNIENRIRGSYAKD